MNLILIQYDDYESLMRARIKSLIDEKKTTNREVSLALNKSPCYIRDILSEKSIPSMKTFLDICNHFNITPKDFFNFDYTYKPFYAEIIEQLDRLLGDDIEKLPSVLQRLSRENVNELIKAFYAVTKAN